MVHSMASDALGQAAKVRKGRWEFLDAARGIAALLVVFQHGFERWSATFRNTWSPQVNVGLIGVVTFFLVSGFIIPISLERYNSLTKFWLGRVLRLGPLYWLIFVVAVCLHHFGWIPYVPGIATGWRFYAGNILILQDVLHVVPALGTFWTLTYEIFFYVSCSVLFALGVLGRTRLWALVSSVGYLAVALISALVFHRSISASKMSLVLTAFIGTLFYRHSKGKVRSSALIQVIAVMAVAVPVTNYYRMFVYPRPGFVNEGTLRSVCLAWVVGYALFIVFYLLRNREYPPALLWLGRTSYSVYLLHGVIALLLPGRLSVGSGMLLLLSITLPLSELTYRFVERPAFGLQHRIIPHRALPAPTAQ